MADLGSGGGGSVSIGYGEFHAIAGSVSIGYSQFRNSGGLGSISTGYGLFNTPPTYASGSVPGNGLTVALEFNEDAPPLLPALSVTGFVLKVGGVSKTISSASRTANTEITLTMAAAIGLGLTVTVDYSPGNVTDSESTPQAMLAFTNQPVTNNSTVPNRRHGGGMFTW